MGQLLQHVLCTGCGHRHHFCLPVGELSPDRPYEYICPETGRKTYLRPGSVGESVVFYPQGAVELVVTPDAAEDSACSAEPADGTGKLR